MANTEETILVIDDTPLNLSILFEALEAAGFRVRVATNGETALISCNHLPPDLILLDIVMPEMDGFETCRRLKSNDVTKDIPVIFITALTESIDEIKAFELGAVDFISKPIQVETVLARVKTQLALRRYQLSLTEKNRQLQQEIDERKKVEQRLKLTQFSVDEAADAIFWVNDQGQIYYVNKMACHLLGYTSEELNNLSLFEIDTNYSTSNWIDNWQRLKVHPMTVESEFQGKDHRPVPVEVTFTYVEFGDQAYCLLFARDITLRRWATNEFLRLEGRYQSLFENAPMSLWEEDWSGVKQILDELKEVGVTDFLTYFEENPDVIYYCMEAVNITDVNQATLQLHSANSKEQLISGLTQVFGPETEKTFKRQLLAITQDQLYFESEVVNYTLTGAKKDLVLKQFVAPGYEHSRGKVLTALVDITEQKQVEVALRESETRYRLLAENSLDLIALLDLQGNILYASPSHYQVLGYDNDTLSHGNVFQLIHTDNHAQVMDAVQNLQSAETNQVVEVSLAKQDGEWITVEAILSTVYSDNQKVDQILLSARDITQRKQTEQALRQANTELDAFARTVAHDLKTPLGIIIGYAEYLYEVAPNSPIDEIMELITRVIEGGHQGANIVNELLLLAGVRKQQVPIRALDMGQVISQARQQLTFLINEYQSEIHFPDTWPKVMGYGPWIREVWVNYLSNGLKYGGKPPRLELGAVPQPDDMIRFWIKDNGPGIPPDSQSRLFTEFTRLEEVRADGHGLGLSIVRRIIDKLGGEVGVNSKLGEGSTFYFTLPAAPSKSTKSDT